MILTFLIDGRNDIDIISERRPLKTDCETQRDQFTMLEYIITFRKRKSNKIRFELHKNPKWHFGGCLTKTSAPLRGAVKHPPHLQNRKKEINQSRAKRRPPLNRLAIRRLVAAVLFDCTFLCIVLCRSRQRAVRLLPRLFLFA